MAGNVKGITIEFRGDTTSLDKALRKIEQDTKAIDRELKQVNKALKFNPTSVELWRQKQDLLKKKIDETTTRLDLLKDTQKRIDAGEIEATADEYRNLQRDIIVTENQVKNFEGQLRKIGNINLRAASEQFKQMGNKLTAAGNAMRGISTAAAAVTAAIGALTVKSGKWADDLNTMSKKYGIGTDELQLYAAAAELVDVDVDTIAKTHTKLTKSMASAQSGTGATADAFEKLGVNVTNADGSLRDSDEVWQETITALGQVANETERDAIAQQLLGKSAANLNPLIEDGGEAYANLAETMAKYNLDFIDQDTLDKANQFNDELDTIKAVGLVAFQQIGTQLAAYLAPALEKVVDLVGRLAEWISNLDPRTQALIAGIAAVVAIAAPLLLGLGKIAFAISSIISLVATIGPAIAGIVGTLGPVILIIGAVVAAGILLYKNWDTIKAKAAALWTNIKTIFNGIKTSIINSFNAVKARVVSIWNGIKNAIMNPLKTAVNYVKNAIAKIKSIINNAKLSLPKFKLPHFKISGGKLPWGIGGKGTAPKISVDWYAKGGIFNSPSIIGVGEAGSEAVVPLDKFWNKLDQIGGGPNIVININGANSDPRAIAEEVKRVLIRETNNRRLAWQ